MRKILIAPARYVQGPGVLADLGNQMKPMGKKAMITGGKTALSVVQDPITRSLREAEIGYHFELFGGESSDREIQRLNGVVKANGCDVVVGAGGGKCLDTAKAVAHECGVPVVIVPTIASTDAPCSALTVVYTDDGVFSRYYVLPWNPNLVLVDSDVIVRAPTRLLVAGMGDGLSTWFEADACNRSFAKNLPGGYSTASALQLARLCYEILIEYGPAAKLAAERGVVSEAVEKVIEANTLLSGLGFESSGLAACHGTHDGLTALPETHHVYHGEKVAFGTLVQCVLENRSSAQIAEVLKFSTSVGLPVSLAEINVTDTSREHLMIAARKSVEPGMMTHNMPFPVDAEMLYAAIVSADAIGRDYLASQGLAGTAR